MPPAEETQRSGYVLETLFPHPFPVHLTVQDTALLPTVQIKDVRIYGAAGDGLIDNTDAISRAISLAPSTGSILYFPPGNYVIEGDIANVTKPIRFVGAGPGLTTLTFPSGASTNGGFAFAASGSGDGNWCGIEGFTFDGSAEQSTRIFPVRIGEAGQTVAPRNMMIRNNRFYRMSGSAVLVRTGTDIWILHNAFDTVGGSATDINDIEVTQHDVDGLYVLGNSGVSDQASGRTTEFLDLELTAAPAGGAGEARNLFIADNHIHNYVLGISLASSAGAVAARRVVITGNTITDVSVGVLLGGTATITDVAIANNILSGGGNNASFPAQIFTNTVPERLLVAGNLSRASLGTAIRVGATDTLVSTNAIIGPTTAGIEILSGAADIQVVGNYVDGGTTGIDFLGTSTACALRANRVKGATTLYDRGSSAVGEDFRTITFQSAAIAAGLTRYIGTFGSQSGTESDNFFRMPAMLVRELHFRATASAGGGQSYTITVRNNAVATAVTLTTSSNEGAEVNFNTSFAAGDLMSVEVVTSAGANTARFMVTVVYVQP